MRGLDTNILVRYITADDAKQTAMAERLMEQSSAAAEPLFIPMAVLCELVWVLSRIQGQTKANIIRVLDNILETRLFQVENGATVHRSVEAFRFGKADFADYLIGEICREAGCEDCVTFDRALADSDRFTVLR